MANTITKQILFNGDRQYIIKWCVTGDGSGDLTNSLVLNATGDIGTSPKLMGIKGALGGFTATLLWDATSKVQAYDLPSNANIDVDFRGFGGISDNAGSGKTGDMLITTTGLSTHNGTLILYFTK